jgi:hypothetical protein
MLVRLGRAKRLRAGWLVALAYLLCVLAPTISFAVPGSHALAPCLTDADRAPGVVHVHNDMPAPHVHKGGHLHDRSGASHTNFGEDRSVSMELSGKSVPGKAPHSADGQCCGIACASALPATLIEIVKPSAPTALCKVDGYAKVTDNAPRRLYRPPIS